MALPRPAGPRALWADFRAFTRERSRAQWMGLVVAVAMPSTILYIFYKDGQTNIAPGEQIVYAESWSGSRTDAEIKAAQIERQKQCEAVQAERQRQFKKLEDRLGM
jgi:hypothetical protein